MVEFYSGDPTVLNIAAAARSVECSFMPSNAYGRYTPATGSSVQLITWKMDVDTYVSSDPGALPELTFAAS